MAEYGTADYYMELIVATQAAINSAMVSKSYNLNSGQGEQRVTRQSLSDLRELKAEYEALYNDAKNNTGLMNIN